MKRREQCGLDLFCNKVGFGILAEQPEQGKPVLNEIPIWLHTNGSSGRLAHSKQRTCSFLQKMLDQFNHHYDHDCHHYHHHHHILFNKAGRHVCVGSRVRGGGQNKQTPGQPEYLER